MVTVTANSVKELRELTNCPLLDCKKALVDANGNIDEAKKLLRERLGSLDTTKPDSGKEGLIVGYINGFMDKENIRKMEYNLFEIGTETDFTANNESVIRGCQHIAECPEIEDSIVKDLRAITGENISCRRGLIKNFVAKDGSLYIHHNRKIAVVVLFAELIDKDIAKNIAMHIAAASPAPICITTSEVPAELIEAEKDFLSKKAMASGKPMNIQEKIIEGGLAKYRASLALNEQPFALDQSKKVKDMVPAGNSIVHFVRWEI